MVNKTIRDPSFFLLRIKIKIVIVFWYVIHYPELLRHVCDIQLNGIISDYYEYIQILGESQWDSVWSH